MSELSRHARALLEGEQLGILVLGKAGADPFQRPRMQIQVTSAVIPRADDRYDEVIDDLTHAFEKTARLVAGSGISTCSLYSRSGACGLPVLV